MTLPEEKVRLQTVQNTFKEQTWPYILLGIRSRNPDTNYIFKINMIIYEISNKLEVKRGGQSNVKDFPKDGGTVTNSHGAMRIWILL